SVAAAKLSRGLPARRVYADKAFGTEQTSFLCSRSCSLITDNLVEVRTQGARLSASGPRFCSCCASAACTTHGRIASIRFFPGPRAISSRGLISTAPPTDLIATARCGSVVCSLSPLAGFGGGGSLAPCGRFRLSGSPCLG